MKKIAILLWLVSLNSYAWQCTDGSSSRNGDLIISCGVYSALSEGSARIGALKRAHEEFKILCGDCKVATIKPARTECVDTGRHIKCYRAMEYYLE